LPALQSLRAGGNFLSQHRIQPTQREITFGEDEIIVSKTDLKGIIQYANRTFLKIAGYSESEVLGMPHSMIRHPDMPRCVFKLLWDTIESGNEIFAYVKNMAKSGDHYWVFAHVTPTFGADNRITGYHSSRRCPERHQIDLFASLYANLLAEEKRHSDWREGMAASASMLVAALAEKKMDYAEFVFSA
jgi:PAS domain S-box-containing protein